MPLCVQISRSRCREPTGGTVTPAEPANGSSITAAMFDASCSAIMSSRRSASSLPVGGWPLWKEPAGGWVWGRRTASEGRPDSLRVAGFDGVAELLAVGRYAADRDAAEVHAVVALFAADQARLVALALGAPVGAGHFQRGVGRFRARTGEEHIVQPCRRQRLDAVGQ